ncbi:MAG: redoxin domain-containing protein [Bacteroidetes bacterium]|nr:redoxin domain-containing protein [Bacteroidota bacterium]
MKHLFKTLLVLSAFISSTTFAGNTPPTGCNIKIVSKGLKEGSMCLLACYYGDKNYIKDSAKANAKGEVIFTATEKYDQGIYLFVPPSKKYFDFVMDAEQNFTLETDTLDYIKHMKVKGSEENKYFYEYQSFMGVKQKQIEPLRDLYKKVKDNKDSAKIVGDQIAAIDKEVMDYKNNFIKAHPTTFVSKIFRAMEEPIVPEAPILANGRKDSTFGYRYYKSHFFDNIDFSDDRLLRTPIFHNKIKQYLDKLTPQTPDSINISTDLIIEKGRANEEVFKYLVNWITYTYESSKIMGMDAVFVHLVNRYHSKKQTPWIDSTQLYKVINRAYILEPLLIGKKAPAVVMQDTTGKEVALYNVKARYTVLLFWDENCGHCKKEMPKIVELYKKLKSKDVQIFAYETEDSPKLWKKFIKDNNLQFINGYQPDQYKRAVTKKIYDIYSTPVIYLLDENKIIKAKRIDAEQLGNLIEMFEKERLEKETKK